LQAAASVPSVDIQTLAPLSADTAPSPTCLAQLFTIVARNVKACTDSVNNQEDLEGLQ
jgi:hypothetical protein